MEMLKAPLAMSLEQNRAQLLHAEVAAKERVEREGDPYGNRHERRLAAKRERQRKRALARS